MSDVWNSDEEIEAVDNMTVEQIRAHVMQPNRCWSDTYCDCVQQHAAERMLEHYDALRQRVAQAELERNTWQSRHSELLDEYKDLRDGRIPELKASLAVARESIAHLHDELDTTTGATVIVGGVHYECHPDVAARLAAAEKDAARYRWLREQRYDDVLFPFAALSSPLDRDAAIDAHLEGK